MDYPSTIFILPDLLKKFLPFAIRCIAAISLIQVVVMVVHKIMLERRERRLALVRSRHLSAMYGVLATGRIEVPPANGAGEIDALADVCIYLLGSASADKRDLIRATVRDAGIAGRYVAELEKARYWVARYRLVEKLGFLELPELAPLFRSMVASDREDVHVVGKASWALSLICREEDLPQILARMSQPEFMSAKFNEHLFVNIISSFGSRGEKAALLQLFERLLNGDLPVLVKRDFIEACGNAGLDEARPLVFSCFQRLGEVPEMRIASLRSLQKLGGEGLDDVIVQGLADPDWRVRAVAAKSVENCSDAVLAALESVLGDANYYVRLNAAASLGRKGEGGRAALFRQMESPDRFVREVARYVLKERDLSC